LLCRFLIVLGRRTRQPFDVSGVKLGMTTAQAKAAMQAAGWQVSSEADLEWDQLVSRNAARQGFGKEQWGVQGRGVGTLRGSKGPEELLVSLRQTASGSGEVRRGRSSSPVASSMRWLPRHPRLARIFHRRHVLEEALGCRFRRVVGLLTTSKRNLDVSRLRMTGHLELAGPTA
jgi:hypothetical protein